MLAFNNWRKQIPHDGLFIVLESCCCVLLSVRGGNFIGIRSLNLRAEDAAGLSAMIQRELLLQGLGEQATVLLHSIGDMAEVKIESGVALEKLQTPGSNDVHPLVQLAMLGER